MQLSSRFASLLAVSVGAAVGATGCGLISQNTPSIDLDLPDQQFAVDTSAWQVSASDAQTYLATSCASEPTACEQAAEHVCNAGCSGTCDASSHTCDLTLEVSLYQAIDVAKLAPEIASVGEATDVKITIDEVTYHVAPNTLDVATPPLAVYLAPASVTVAGSMATEIGTIAAVPAATTTGDVPLAFTADGEAQLSTAISAYDTPFNILVGGELQLRAGDAVPTGKLAATLHIAAHAGL